MIGIIGGSGLYALFDDARTEKVTTPYGEPSAAITVAEVDGRPVAFLPRHGEDHRFPAHRVPYRANLWALRALGCRQILAPCAVGGLRPEFGPGTFVLPDQLVDRTTGRDRTYYDDGAVHVTFADPYCPALREAVSAAAVTVGQAVHEGGTVVVIDGPRFSTRAESRWYAAAGGTVVNMTAAPEAALARELALCYATVALVTDVDAGVDGERGVSQDEVFAVFARNIERLRRLLLASVATVPVTRSCPCPSTLDAMTLPFALP